jgi:RNA polymerase sigma factor (sigma-70 family)
MKAQLELNEKNFSAIYNANYSYIFNFVNFKLNVNKEVANEIVNDTFVKVYKNMDSFNPESSKLTTWIITIAKNLVIDYIRKEQKHFNDIKISDFVDEKGNEFFSLPDTKQADHLVNNNEINKQVNKAVSNLTDNQKTLYKLFFVDQLSYDEISECLEMPLGSVKANISRLRDCLQKNLKKTYKELA